MVFHVLRYVTCREAAKRRRCHKVDNVSRCELPLFHGLYLILLVVGS